MNKAKFTQPPLESLACHNCKCELIGRLGQDSLTLADIYFGRAEELKSRREEIKQATLGKRRRWHRQGVQDRLYWESGSPLNLNPKMSH